MDPTSASGALYSTNLIRSMTGFKGVAQIPLYTSIGASNHNSLQIQVNRRVGRRFQFSSNYTWSKLLTYSHNQFTDDQLTKTVAIGGQQGSTVSRPHAVNAKFGYEIPGISRFVGNNGVSKQMFDGWKVSGTAQLYYGVGMNVACNYFNNPVGWPNGTPTGGVLFRCDMPDASMPAVWLQSGAQPSSVGSTADPRLWYPFNPGSFVLPTISSTFTRGMIGNEPPILTYGPGVELFNLSLAKEFKVRESQSLAFRVEAINAFNHFNPANPNTTLNLNYRTGANTNAAFGTITASQYNNRRAILSLRYVF